MYFVAFFPKETKNMFTVFLLSYSLNSHESFGEGLNNNNSLE